MIRYIIIGRSSCPFCIMAADLCSASHKPYIFLDYEEKQEILEDYKVEALPFTIFFYRGKVVKINYGAVNFMSKPILKKLEGILEND